jgi:hypothetical protein
MPSCLPNGVVEDEQIQLLQFLVLLQARFFLGQNQGSREWLNDSKLIEVKLKVA